jgi:hypothetical protein
MVHHHLWSLLNIGPARRMPCGGPSYLALQQRKRFRDSPRIACSSNAKVICAGDNRVRNRAMAHKGLKGTCIDSVTSQSIARSLAQHVSVDREWQLSGHTKPFN